MEYGVGGKSLYFSLCVLASYRHRIWQEMIGSLAISWQGSKLSIVE